MWRVERSGMRKFKLPEEQWLTRHLRGWSPRVTKAGQLNRNVWQCVKNLGQPSGGDTHTDYRRRQSRSRLGRPAPLSHGNPFAIRQQPCTSSDPAPGAEMVQGVAQGDRTVVETVIHPTVPGECYQEGTACCWIQGGSEDCGHSDWNRRLVAVGAQETIRRYQRRGSRSRRSFL